MAKTILPRRLLMLKNMGQSYGFDLAGDLSEYALRDSAIESAALYRTLRRREAKGYVQFDWVTPGTGPARRVYLLTRDGEQRLEEWAEVLDHLSRPMGRFAKKVRIVMARDPTPNQQK